MLNREIILQAIFEAIDEANEANRAGGTSGGGDLERSAGALLVGDGSPLDSTSFLTLIISVEQNLERLAEVSVQVIDLIDELPETGWTAGDLAARIEQEVQGQVPA